MADTSIDTNKRTMINTSSSLQHLLPMQRLHGILQRFAHSHGANSYLLETNGTVLHPPRELTDVFSIIPTDSIIGFHAALNHFLSSRQHHSMQPTWLACHGEIGMLCAPIMIGRTLYGAICIGPFVQESVTSASQCPPGPSDQKSTAESHAGLLTLTVEKEHVLCNQLHSVAELLAEIACSTTLSGQLSNHATAESNSISGFRGKCRLTEEVVEQLQIVAELNDQVVYDYDLRTGQVHWFGPVQELTGYPLATLNAEGFVGWAEHIHADDQAVTIARLEAADQQQKPFALAYRFCAANGSLLHLHEHGVSLYNEENEPVRMIGVISTIPGKGVTVTQKCVSDALVADAERSDDRSLQSVRREPEASGDDLFRALFNACNEAILLVDFQGMVLDANPAFLRQSGYSMAKIITLPFQDVIVEPDQQRFVAMVTGQRSGKTERETLSVSYRNQNGTVVPVVLTSWVVVDQANKSHCLGLFLRNIGHELAWAENKAVLEKQVIRSQQNVAIGSLARGVGHDFNSILGGIIGYAELALYRNAATVDPKMQDYLKRVLESGNRAKNLVQQMLRFGQMSTKTLEPIQLTQVLAESIRLLRLNVPPSIRLNPHLTAKKDRILGDSGQLHQLVMNLAVNACHAMRESGGLLTIALDNITVEAPRQWMNTSISPGIYLRLQVNDTGTGMPPTVLEQIFQPYFTTKNINEGNGLGMTVVLDIVKNHRGWIDIESTMGKGTNCTVCLPLAADNEAERTIDNHVPMGQGQRVLVVDDEHFFAEVIGETLKMLGYEVTLHRSSLDALNTFTAHPDDFDLLVTDQAMPEMTGVQLAREIRALDRDVPIILCTGYSEIFTEMAIASYGITSLLMKPVHIHDLATTVHAALARHPVASEQSVQAGSGLPVHQSTYNQELQESIEQPGR